MSSCNAEPVIVEISPTITAGCRVAVALSKFAGVPLWTGLGAPALHEVAVAAAVLIAAVVVATASNRFVALLALGVVGYGVALFFVFFGAPDLAITQILVETLALVLFVLIV
jgi:multicomponent Na+:H+ antiporter subunit A